MPKTIITIKTWRCAHCGYSQDFEPTQENMNLHFNNDERFRLSNVGANECPSCGLKGLRGKHLAKESRQEKKVTITVMGEEDVDAVEVPDETAQPDEKGERPKRKLSLQEKQAMREKIRADIQKFRALED